MGDNNNQSANYAAAAQLAGTGLQVASAANANRKQRKWMEKQYDKQRQHALEDWQRQIDYNNPAAQMQRFRDAGLNPHLIYGTGVQAQEAPNVRQSETGSYRPSEADFSGVGNAVAAYYNTKMQQAQTDNVALQGELIQKQILKTDVETLAISKKIPGYEAESTIKGVDAKIKGETYNNEIAKSNLSVKQAEENLNITKQSISINEQRNIREIAANSQNIKESLARIALMYAQGKNYAANTELTQSQITKLNYENTRLKERIDAELSQKKWSTLIDKYEALLREKGQTFSDPFITRTLGAAGQAVLSGLDFFKGKKPFTGKSAHTEYQQANSPAMKSYWQRRQAAEQHYNETFK